MAFFPRLAMGEFTPLFRMLDDYASHQITRGIPSAASSASAHTTFQPRFDVKENEGNYELHGELPGVSQKDVDIEFTDAQTLKISGRAERHTEINQRPDNAAIEGRSEQHAITGSDANHQPSVEDEIPTKTATPNDVETTVARANASQEQGSSPRYWLSERSVGHFQRTFNFPDRIDSEAVRASLKDGILSVIVPKAQELARRRIVVE